MVTPAHLGTIKLTRFGGELNGKRDRQQRVYFLTSPKVEGLGDEGRQAAPFVDQCGCQLRMSNLRKMVTHAAH